MERYENSAKIVGTLTNNISVSHTYSEEVYFFLAIEVRHDETSLDVIHVFAPESLVLGMDLIKGDTLSIEGELVHSKAKGRYDVSVVASTLKKVPIYDTKYDNTVVVSGVINQSYPLKYLDKYGKSVKVLILKNTRNDGSGRYFTLRVVAWNKLAESLESNYNVGDKVLVRGKLESKEIFTGDTSVNLHEVVATSISKVTNHESE